MWQCNLTFMLSCLVAFSLFSCGCDRGTRVGTHKQDRKVVCSVFLDLKIPLKWEALTRSAHLNSFA
jgi:hypothetical protein